MIPEYLGPLALGILIGAVAVLIALYSGVEIVIIPTRACRVVAAGEDGRDSMMKDCFDKPIKIVNVCNIRPGDFIHDISYSSLIDSEKRKGYVVYARRIESGQVALRLQGRKTPLEVPITANAVVTHASPPASGFASQLRPDKTPLQATIEGAMPQAKRTLTGNPEPLNLERSDIETNLSALQQ